MASDRYIRTIHKLVQFLLGLPYFAGRDFITEKIPQLLLPKVKGSTVVPTVYGFKINVNPESDKGVDAEIYLYGTYELGTAHILGNILQKGDSFIDVGANIGFFTLMASLIVTSSGKVYAFEPYSKSLDLLNVNIKLNDIGNISVYDFALGADMSEKRIYPEPGNRGGSSLIKNESNQGDGSELVHVKALNEIQEVVMDQTIKARKIDVEGWELEVLKGCSTLFNLDNPPVLIVEYSSISLRKTDERLELIDYIRVMDKYKIYKLKRGKGRVSKLVLIESNDQLPDHDNLFCFTNNQSGNLPERLFE